MASAASRDLGRRVAQLQSRRVELYGAWNGSAPFFFFGLLICCCRAYQELLENHRAELFQTRCDALVAEFSQISRDLREIQAECRAAGGDHAWLFDLIERLQTHEGGKFAMVRTGLNVFPPIRVRLVGFPLFSFITFRLPFGSVEFT